MKYYLLKELENIRKPDIFNYNQVINYQAFSQNQSYKISKRNICVTKSPTDFVDILFTPFPLFSENAKNALDLFLWECEYKEYDFLSHDRSESFHYYLPFFWRIIGKCQERQRLDGIKYAEVTLQEEIPEDMPIIYLDAGMEFLMLARLDLIESLLRRGICSVQMKPAYIEVRRD